ncbi:MAG: thiamine-phosphate kinase [Acidobacteria bacterium]|nr:MAG: thiamine-phosphate kinase [Acidobacteriota bacterium]
MKSEFQFINSIKDRFSLSEVGDDCAVLPKDKDSDLLISADLLVQDVDFRLEWSNPADIGHKSLAVSLSDIAAMGGTPLWGLLSLAVPKSLWNDDFLDNFYEGWHFLAKKHGVELVGGDISSTTGKFVIDSIVVGEVPKDRAIRRSGANPGDHIYVSGTLGGAAGGLRLLETSQIHPKLHLIEKQLRPAPQVELGKQLNALGIVTSMIDISDGLSSDLAHICRSSGVGASINIEKIPIDPNLAETFPDRDENLELAINGGEDFELLFTVSPEDADQLRSLDVVSIGTITEHTDILEIFQKGNTKELRPGGFRHF